MTHQQIPKTHKILFWLILGAFSTFFAEVFAGSDMFPFFHIWGILVTIPLYGLHVIVLTTIIFKYGKPRLSSLVFAGMLFGLYESYLTKVLWNPDWETIIKIGDVAVVEVFVLVFWWHTWLSFIMPLAIVEQLLTTSQNVLNCFSGKLRNFLGSWKGYLTLAVFGGVFQSVNSPSVEQSLLSGVSSTSLLFLLIWIWRGITHGKTYELPELLPNKKEFQVLILWLCGLYVFLGIYLFPERIPGLLGQSIILALYAILAFLFVQSLSKSHQEIQEKSKHHGVPPKYWLLIWLFFLAALVATKLFLSNFAAILLLGNWVFGSAIGVAMFYKAIKEVYGKLPIVGMG